VSREVQLKDGDSLFFYTDGLVETENAHEEEFGMERLERLLLRERERGFESILANVEKVACEFRGDVEAADDATMALVRIGEAEGSHAQV
jgi:serine phosphatase RsbU (regulator of sigma subunit)